MPRSPAADDDTARQHSATRTPDRGGRATWKWVLTFIAASIVVLLHAWALAALYFDGPAARRHILVIVYAGLLIGSALLSKRFRPPLAASLIPFAVVAIWWWIHTDGASSDWVEWIDRGAALIPSAAKSD